MFIFIAFLLSVLSLVLAYKIHDKFDPARYFLLMWGAQIIVIYLLFHKFFIFTGFGLVLITLYCILFSVGTVIGFGLGNQIRQKEQNYSFDQQKAFGILAICFTLAIIFVWKGIHSFGYDLKQILSLKILLELNNAASVSRYNDEQTGSLINQILLVFIYATPLLGGYLLPLVKRRLKIFCYLSIIPAVLVTATQSIKSLFITSVALWIIGVLVSSYANNKLYLRVKQSTILKIAISGFVFFMFLFLTMIFRTGTFDLETVLIIRDKLVIYAFGHLPAFDIWYSQNVGEINPSFGVKTFYGITNYLGIEERKLGIFTEFTSFAHIDYKEIAPDLETNVYTLFRLLVEDFGTVGSIIFLFITGTISGYSIIAIRKCSNSIFFQVVLISILFMISWSFVASVFAYTSYIVTLVLIYFLIKLSLSSNPQNLTNKNHEAI